MSFREIASKRKKKIPPGIHDKGRIKYHEISVQKKKKVKIKQMQTHTHTKLIYLPLSEAHTFGW